MITRMTRGHVDLDLDGRTVTILGEGFLQGPIDYLVIRGSIQYWDDGTEVSDSEREAILDDFRASAVQRGLRIEIE